MNSIEQFLIQTAWLVLSLLWWFSNKNGSLRDLLLARCQLSRFDYMFWGWIVYAPINHLVRYEPLVAQDGSFQIAHILLIIPFLLFAIAFSVRRLRLVNLPLALALISAIPFANLLFWLLLSLCDDKNKTESVNEQQNLSIRSAIKSILFSSVIGLAATVLSIKGFSMYGWGLFVFLPFIIGTISSVLYGSKQHRTFGQCQLVMFISIFLLGVLLLSCAIEGVFCLLMASPIALLLGFFGATLGYFIQPVKQTNYNSKTMLFCMPLLIPSVFAIEAYTQPKPPLCEVSTTININAPANKVWRALIKESVLTPDPRLAWLGINSPMSYGIKGKGVGAIRYCRYEIGRTIIEPIEVWQEPSVLKFTVNAYPPVMRETSPYTALHPLHIDNHYVALAGQFSLSPSKNGTRLTATSWYQHNVWPTEYWSLWSNFIMHQMQTNILANIKKTSEI